MYLEPAIFKRLNAYLQCSVRMPLPGITDTDSINMPYSNLSRTIHTMFKMIYTVYKELSAEDHKYYGDLKITHQQAATLSPLQQSHIALLKRGTHSRLSHLVADQL